MIILNVLFKSFFISLFFIIATMPEVDADDLSIQILRDIDFKNGYGQIQAKPILKNVTSDIKVMGEFNVNDSNGNVEMKIDKVLYENKIYSLSEPFTSKRRLKNKSNAKLAKDSKIKLNNGSHAEILAILNGESSDITAKTNTKQTTTNSDNNNSSGSGTTYSSYGSGRSSDSSSSDYTPYLLSDTSSSSSTSSTTSCSDPTIANGKAIVYTLKDGNCVKNELASSLIYKKYNTSTCADKVDYENLSVTIGEEQYVMVDDVEYRVGSCAYNETTSLLADSSTCTPITDFSNYLATIRKKYYYTWDGEETTASSCVASDEQVTLYDDDYNSCKYRYDFVNNVAIKQTQWYYYYDNIKTDVGECVDASDLDSFSYALYETQEGCDCEEVTLNGATSTLCQTKLSFNGINGGKEDATECRYVDSLGTTIYNEMTGYAFKDESKQAIKKVNQYYYGKSNEKIYIAKDVETNEAFDYIYESCGWEHDEDLYLSYHKTRIYIQDDELANLPSSATIDTSKIFDTNKYEVSSCSANIDSVIYWSQLEDLKRGELNNHYTEQVIAPTNFDSTATSWFVYTLDSNPYLEDYYINPDTLMAARQNPNDMDIKSKNLTLSNYLLASATYTHTVTRCWGTKYSNTDHLTINLPFTSMDLFNSDEVSDYGNFQAYYYTDKYQTIYKLNTPYSTSTDYSNTLTYEYTLDFESPVMIYASSVDYAENLVTSSSDTETLYEWDTQISEYEDEEGKIHQITNQIYTSGVSFTPFYDISSIESQNYCSAGELQYLNIEYDEYEPLVWDEDNYTYKEYVELIKNDAMNTQNYKITISGVTCQKDVDTDINKAYVIGSIMNYYKAYGMTQKLADSLNLSASMSETKTLEETSLCKQKTTNAYQYKVNASTKTNWFNQQDVYEYKMYRQFRRPDGTYFDLYERLGYYLVEQE